MIVFILIYETMYTINDLIDSLKEETRIINHLFSKIPFEKEWILQYMPNEDQRSLKELLEYMMIMGNMLSAVLEAWTYTQELVKPIKDALHDISLENEFQSVMNTQLETVGERLRGMESTMEDMIDPFWAWAMMRKTYVLEVLLKTYTAYRMQLFLYLKDSGERQLNTANVWQGRDME